MQMLVLLSHDFFKVYTVTYIHYICICMYILWVVVCVMNIGKSSHVSSLASCNNCFFKLPF